MSHGSPPTRRTFLKALAASGAGTFAFLNQSGQGLTAGSIVPFGVGRARAAAPSAKYVFIYLEGGVCGDATFDPKFFAELRRASGPSLGAMGLAPESSIGGVTLPGYAQVELARSTPIPRSHNVGDPKYTPPIFSQNGIQLGFAAEPLLDHTRAMTLVRGVTIVPEHGIATRTLWTSQDFQASSPRATIDCLVAARVNGDLLFPHLHGLRSAYVPLGIPATAIQVPFPLHFTRGAQYEAAILTPLTTAFSPKHPAYVGEDATKAVNAFVTQSSAAQLEALQNPANADLLQGISGYTRILERINQSEVGDALRTGIDDFIQRASRSISLVGSLEQFNIDQVVAAFGMIATAFNQNLSSVATMNIANGGFDAHSGIWTNQGQWYRMVMHALSFFLKTVDLSTTNVVVMTDFTRAPIMNARAGRDHGGSTYYALFGPIGQNRVFGATDDFQDPLPVDPKTGQPTGGGSGMRMVPAHINALLLEMAGYLPGREIQSQLGNVSTPDGPILQAPDFLRDLIPS